MYRDKLEEVLDRIDEIIVLGAIEVDNYFREHTEVVKPVVDYIFNQEGFKTNVEELYSILMGRLKEEKISTKLHYDRWYGYKGRYNPMGVKGYAI